jgi:hypothetical protein
MATRAELYAEQVQKLINGAKSLSPSAQAAVEKALADADREILGRIALLNPKSYTAVQLASLRNDIDQALVKFRATATTNVNALQAQAATMANKGMSDTVSAALGMGQPIGTVNMQTVLIAQGYTADLITGLSADAASKVKGVVQRAFLGGQSMGEIIEGVGRAMNGGKFSGIFTDVGDRAMRISLNEILRVHSIAGQARLEDLASRNKAIKKQWLHLPIGVPRLGHLLADGQTVPVDEPFEIDGEELMFPRDPSGSPENTINCHCVSVPFIADSELYATADDRATLARVGLKVSVG